MSQGDVFVGIDLGTSGMKGVALDEGSGLVASAGAGYPTARPGQGSAEQSTDDWMASAAAVMTALAAKAAPSRWSAIGLSAMIPTLVTEDEDGRAIGPAVTWEDARAQEDARDLLDRVGVEELRAATGQLVDGRYLLPMFARIRREEPERAAATAVVAGAKDHLFRCLTGVVATDPSTATGFGCFDLTSGSWMRTVADCADVSLSGERSPGRPELPPVLDAFHAMPLSSEAGDELALPPGIPVALGTADSVAGALGLGVDSPGTVAYMAGTSTVIIGVCDRAPSVPKGPFVVTPLADPHSWGLEMDLVATGSSIRWLGNVLGLGGEDQEDEVLRLAEKSPPGASGVWFLPYLGFGEQGALWDPDLRGAIGGLTLSNGPEDLARALIEGIALESRRCITALTDGGLAPSLVRVGGAAANSPFFLRVLAGATGLPVESPLPVGELASAVGAARTASRAVGRDVGPPQGPPRRRIEPTRSDGSLWSVLWTRHEMERKGRRQ